MPIGQGRQGGRTLDKGLVLRHEVPVAVLVDVHGGHGSGAGGGAEVGGVEEVGAAVARVLHELRVADPVPDEGLRREVIPHLLRDRRRVRHCDVVHVVPRHARQVELTVSASQSTQHHAQHAQRALAHKHPWSSAGLCLMKEAMCERERAWRIGRAGSGDGAGQEAHARAIVVAMASR